MVALLTITLWAILIVTLATLIPSEWYVLIKEFYADSIGLPKGDTYTQLSCKCNFLQHNQCLFKLAISLCCSSDKHYYTLRNLWEKFMQDILR